MDVVFSLKLCDCRVGVAGVIHIRFRKVNRPPVLFASSDWCEWRPWWSRISLVPQLFIPVLFLVPAVSNLPETGGRIIGLFEATGQRQSARQWFAPLNLQRIVIVPRMPGTHAGKESSS